MGVYAERIFPWIMDNFMKGEHVSAERSAALFRVEGDVLEVGVGTGLNLPHYPDGVRSLTAVDPSEGMLRIARPRAASFRLPVTLALQDAEALPFEDGRFDAVVSTWTLCTIPDAPRALGEVRRVLRPGGRFFFLEHGLADDARTCRLQELLNPLNRIVSCGCNLNRDIEGLVADSGLDIVELHRYLMPRVPRLFSFVAHLYRGIARREL